MKRIFSRLNESWCKLAHPAPMWPVHGRYRCPSCHRVYSVAWEPPGPVPTRPAAAPAALGELAAMQAQAKRAAAAALSR